MNEGKKMQEGALTLFTLHDTYHNRASRSSRVTQNK